MFRKKNSKLKPQQIYYLLPGMADMAKQRFVRHLKISFVVGIIVAILFGILIYYKDKLEGL